MATHPHGAAVNGHGNGGTRLEKLLAHYEEAATAIRLTMSLLNGHATTAKTNGHVSVLAQAVALDGARVAKKAKKKKHRPHDRAALLAQRTRTAQLLDLFDTKKARPATNGQARGFAPLINHGYLRKKRGGYVRTNKAYVVDPFAKAG